jgi:hypothetical protein
MFEKKKNKIPKVPRSETFKNLKLSFEPEEIVKVMSDIKVEIGISDMEYHKIIDLIDRYDNSVPKIKIVLKSASMGTLDLSNVSLEWCGVKQ